jgi:transposase
MLPSSNGNGTSGQPLKKSRSAGRPPSFHGRVGFLLIPNVAKTWAPIGETPIIHHSCWRDKVSVISGVSVSPQRQRLSLYYFLFYDNIAQQEVCLFLRHLLRHLHGEVIVLLDNSTTHKGQPLEELLRRHPRLHVEYFPTYAPELNPDEGIWSQPKTRTGERLSERPLFCAKLLHYLCLAL